MDAAGFDDVLLETVGVGQAEIDVVDHADTVVLALMPGSGDSIQALKAGVMEIPDVIVVNKAEHPLTDTMVREVRTALSLGPSGDWKVPIIKTVASEGDGHPRAARRDRGAPRPRRGDRHPRGAPRPQPPQRGPRPRRRADATRARAADRRGRVGRATARERRPPGDRSRDRRRGAARAQPRGRGRWLSPAARPSCRPRPSGSASPMPRVRRRAARGGRRRQRRPRPGPARRRERRLADLAVVRLGRIGRRAAVPPASSPRRPATRGRRSRARGSAARPRSSRADGLTPDEERQPARPLRDSRSSRAGGAELAGRPADEPSSIPDA